MIRRTLGAALALVLALGDFSWAGQFEAPKTSALPAPLTAPQLPAVNLQLPQTQLGVEQIASALPQLSQTAAPLTPEAQATDASAATEQNRRWDAAQPNAGRSAEPVAAAPEAVVPSGLSPASPSARSAPSGRIPMPRVALARAGMMAGWAAYTGLAVLAHAPFDRIAPMILGAVFGAMSGFMVMFFVGAAQDQGGWGSGPAPKEREVTPDEHADALAHVTRLAAEAKLPAPKRFNVIPNDVLNAAAGGGDKTDYEVRIHGGVLDLPADQREAILRHEVSHVKHADTWWMLPHGIIAAVPPMILLMAGMRADWLSYLGLPAIVASIAAFGAIRKVDEFHADQYAAATQGTAKPLIAAFREMQRRDAEDRLAERRAVEGSPWRMARLKASDAWDKVAALWRAHPSMDRRIRRLERLETRN